MSNVISATDYKALADDYAAARERVLAVNQDLFDAVYAIVLFNELMPEVDLLNVFWTSYLVSANAYESPSSLMAAVRALNNHVIVRGGYADINAFFAANPGLFVDTTWQVLSAEAGYDISDTYVTDYI